VPQDQADSLVAWLSDGRSLREWCRQPGNTPWQTVYCWIDKDEEFGRRIARAREDGYDELAEKALRIAFEACENQVEVTQRRLQIDTILKLLAKWNPRKYGDRQTVDHGGGVTLNVITGVPNAA
jgi:hypothetical protein